MITKRERPETFVNVFPAHAPIHLENPVLRKKCRSCGTEFVTRSPIKKRCPACQSRVQRNGQRKANARRKQERQERRLGRIL